MSHPCPHAGRCGGCGRFAHESAAHAADAREAAVRQRWTAAGLPVPTHGWSVDARFEGHGQRDWADLAKQGAALGLRSLDGTEVVDTPTCVKHSPALAELAAHVRADPPPVERANLRLRTGPGGLRGIAVVAGNLDIKCLLDETAWIARQEAAGIHLALGQRGKPPRRMRHGYKLHKQLPLSPWWTTHHPERGTVPVIQSQTAFSQPSRQSTEHVARTVVELLQAGPAVSSVLEVGAGSGSLTVALAALWRVTALEPHPIARAGLAETIARQNIKLDGVLAQTAGKSTPALQSALAGADAVVADPPRGGLAAFLDRLSECDDPPRVVVLVSCGEDALIKDAELLCVLGYEPREIVAIDQFPWTTHAERVVRFEAPT